MLTVPLQSVVLRPVPPAPDDRAGVFLVADGQARFSPVTTGVIGGLDIEVSGVADGASVIIGPYQALRDMRDGALVRVADVPAGTAGLAVVSGWTAAAEARWWSKPSLQSR